ERLRLSGPRPRRAVDHRALHDGRAERRREVLLPAPEVEPAGGRAEPRSTDRAVDLFLGAHGVEDCRAHEITRSPQLAGEARRVIEVPSLEADPHGRDEAWRLRARRHTIPEPVAHGEVAEVCALELEVSSVPSHVLDLIERDLQ